MHRLGRPLLCNGQIDGGHQKDGGHGHGHFGEGQGGAGGPRVAGLEEGLRSEGGRQHSNEGKASGGGVVDVQAGALEDEDDGDEDGGAKPPRAGGEVVEGDRWEDQTQDHSLHPPQVPLQRRPREPGQDQGDGGREGEVVPVDVHAGDEGQHVGDVPAEDEIYVPPLGEGVHRVEELAPGCGSIVHLFLLHEGDGELPHDLGQGGEVVDQEVLLQEEDAHGLVPPLNPQPSVVLADRLSIAGELVGLAQYLRRVGAVVPAVPLGDVFAEGPRTDHDAGLGADELVDVPGEVLEDPAGCFVVDVRRVLQPVDNVHQLLQQRQEPLQQVPPLPLAPDVEPFPPHRRDLVVQHPDLLVDPIRGLLALLVQCAAGLGAGVELHHLGHEPTHGLGDVRGLPGALGGQEPGVREEGA
mmetsp:Transcript_78072/g.208719  ORF Transcript_78072/g.208719 Transcript_78072/m.208719 type:complete len:411 (-) Transcript_78072:428-1660(-)